MTNKSTFELSEEQKKYYRELAQSGAQEIVENGIQRMKIDTGIAYDIGCGSCRDSVALLKDGWKVYSIDARNMRFCIKENVTKEENSRSIFLQTSFKQLEFPEKADLILAIDSLPFCKNKIASEEEAKQVLKVILEKIKRALKKDGVFITTFFGKNHDWANNEKKSARILFLDKKDIEGFFDDTFSVEISEKCSPANLYNGGVIENWHSFEVIAQRVKEKQNPEDEQKEGAFGEGTSRGTGEELEF